MTLCIKVKGRCPQQMEDFQSEKASLHLKCIELHMISKEHLVVLVITMAHFRYHVSSNWLTSYISLVGVFCGKAGRERDIPQYLVINPLGVTAFSGTLERKLSEDTSVPWRKTDFMPPWLFTSNIQRKLLRSLSHVYLYLWFPYFILFWIF